jgi:hypothetical protein
MGGPLLIPPDVSESELTQKVWKIVYRIQIMCCRFLIYSTLYEMMYGEKEGVLD